MKKKTVIITIVAASVVLIFVFAAVVIFLALNGQNQLEFTGFGDKVAIVELTGEIISSSDFIRQVDDYIDDNSVKAIVVHINSPGGGVAESHEMYESLLRARDNGKVVVAALTSVAASGGYYVACAADQIVSNPGTLTGSIGVIMSFPTAGELFDKIGLRWETIKSGELKDVGNFSRPMTEHEERMLKAVIDDVYEQFVQVVSVGRDKPVDEIYPLADGSIFSGRQAYNLGLVDTLGTLHDAISLAGELSGLGPNPDVIREHRTKPGFMDLLGNLADLAERLNRMDSNTGGMLYLYQH